jgi:16S rRNA (guanine527-N7)-methyltransferase
MGGATDLDDTQRGRLAATLAAGVTDLGVPVGEAQQARLIDYLALLHRWNRAYNLTAVRDPAEMVVRHLLDSLSILPLVAGPRVLDVGSGAGLPGLVLALAVPALEVTLLDPAAKRVRFLEEAVLRLAPGNVTVQRERVEAFRPAAPFDTVLCRAFTALPRFLAAAAPLTAPGGLVLAMKGGRAAEELAEVPESWRAGARVVPLAVPGLDAARQAVLLRPPAGSGANSCDTVR